MPGLRRKTRIIALQALYEIDSTGHDADDVINQLLAESDLSEENVSFSRELVKGVTENQKELDSHIEKFAPAWPLNQLPVVDRNILRLAIFEILLDNRVSIKIAINEAVELAKTFGGENSSKFVNGVLGSISTFAGEQKAS